MKKLLQKLFRGTASKAEMLDAFKWLSRPELEQELKEDLKEFIHTDHPYEAEFDRSQQWKHLQSKMPNENTKKVVRFGNANKRWLSAAAISVIIFSSALVIYLQQSLVVDPVQETTEKIITKSTQAGQKSNIFLPDGSLVILNAESTISYPETFSVDRLISLEGEAYFDVRRDTANPFLVTSNGVITKVLGTSFNIRSRMDEQDVAVSLVSGKVQVQLSDVSTHELVPGKRITFNKSSEKFNIDDFETELVCSWKDGILYFQEAEFSEIIKTLELWYGVKFSSTGQPDKEIDYTGKFINENLENVLHGIGFIMHFNFQIEGKNVTIDFR